MTIDAETAGAFFLRCAHFPRNPHRPPETLKNFHPFSVVKLPVLVYDSASKRIDKQLRHPLSRKVAKNASITMTNAHQLRAGKTLFFFVFFLVFSLALGESPREP